MSKQSLRRILIVVMACVLLLLPASSVSAESYGKRIHFVPTEITVESQSVTVEGYFVNLNTNVSVGDFSDFQMMVYREEDLLVEGYFGNINKFSISPLSVKFQSFTFNGHHDLNVGRYECDDTVYALCGFDFAWFRK